MCIICSRTYNGEEEEIEVCEKVLELPELYRLKKLYINGATIKIPSLENLRYFTARNCVITEVGDFPDITVVNLLNTKISQKMMEKFVGCSVLCIVDSPENYSLPRMENCMASLICSPGISF
jgi:hypothetical protein